jgi:hypothetical protein
MKTRPKFALMDDAPGREWAAALQFVAVAACVALCYWIASL